MNEERITIPLGCGATLYLEPFRCGKQLLGFHVFVDGRGNGTFVTTGLNDATLNQSFDDLVWASDVSLRTDNVLLYLNKEALGGLELALTKAKELVAGTVSQDSTS